MRRNVSKGMTLGLAVMGIAITSLVVTIPLGAGLWSGVVFTLGVSILWFDFCYRMARLFLPDKRK